ncbi:hypothetical protein TSUD_146310 [Trifolium subterraneum]|uniref:Reverse transcriptase domain-containing protein n=1 Tax=Trifolium subterraneum TaxID=3900 RepID=A0A2Z6MGQ6_TRISU|nr:hypothetical protein TSUD_146310 [Trifolium subterraneum]
MSISINGAQKGYFKCLRGVRQGDPISPILFFLAEEVLSRGISNLVQEGKIELIKGSRNSPVPSHCLYADDIMVFCKGKFASLQALQALFTSYASCSGQVGSLPFNYLGVPIFKVYTWPVSLLKTIETWSRNFIWSGDINKRKLVTVAWKYVCVPYSEGGLGLRSLISLNEDSNLKLCWDFLHSEESWAQILRNRALRNGKVIGHHISSSLWSSIKSEFSCLMENSNWLVGNGKDIKLWEDSWCGEPLQITNNDLTWLPNKQVTLSNQSVPDKLIWKHNSCGVMSMKDAYKFKRSKTGLKSWAKLIWCNEIPPSQSLLVWRLMLDKIPTDEKLMTRGCNLPSMCSLCCTTAESTFHLFFSCQFAFNLWCWLATILNLTIQFQCMEDLWRLCDRAWSPRCKVAIKSTIVNIINSIWMARNKARFNNRANHWKNVVSWISANTLIADNRTSLCSNASLSDFRILKHFNISIHPPRAPCIKEIIWKPPCASWVKCNSDGASTHASSSCGGIFRNHHADFYVALQKTLGSTRLILLNFVGQ